MGNQIHDINKYKKSLLYLKHLETIINVIDLSLRALKFYEPYTSVAKIMRIMENEKAVLQSHLEQCKKIKESKGKRNS